jgi:hypothetical protein
VLNEIPHAFDSRAAPQAVSLPGWNGSDTALIFRAGRVIILASEAMNIPRRQKILWVLATAVFLGAAARAQNLGQIGVTLLRTMTTNVDGSGIRVAQPEAGLDTNNPPMIWEVNPAATGRSSNLFTYISSNGSSSNYTNSLGSESGHADSVAGFFYGIPGGVATNVAHMDNYEANYFYNSIIAATLPASINDRVVNQSFIFNGSSVSDQQTIDSDYDNYAAEFGTLFVSGAGNGVGSGNGGRVNPPATCYNGIGVGVSDGSSSVGPTLDNGRAKPDIVAPGGETSFSTPLVSGAAAVLMQAGLRGDGGSDTNSAADIRTVKSLLLNGAIKPAGWTNNFPSPLDTRYGAGVLNVFNSYEQLAGGKHGYVVSASVSSGAAHPPTGNSGTVGALSGWDFNSISSTSAGIFSSATDGVNHYYFNVTNNLNGQNFTATATLVWNRQQNQTAINNLDLFLYNCASSNLVVCSTSLVDNVEHVWLPRLPQGRYDLQVLKNSGNSVSGSESYALAWEFFTPTLNVANTGANIALTFPVYPAGFFVEAATSLSPPVNWNTNLPPPVVTDGQNLILLDPTNAAQFFRLRRP